MTMNNRAIGFVLAISAILSACSIEPNRTSETLSLTQKGDAPALGTYVVIDCKEPAGVLVDKAGIPVNTPVRLTMKADKQTLVSISLRAEIPAHTRLEDTARTAIGERIIELSDARVVSGSRVNTRSGQGIKYGIAENQKIEVTKSGKKTLSNLKSIKISEANGADYLSIFLELEGNSTEVEVVGLSNCAMKNTALLDKYPR